MESRLGLVAPQGGTLDRLAAYEEAMRDAISSQEGGRLFFQESWEKDSLAAAARLLSWRDELALCGWEGGEGWKAEPVSSRLMDLARVERPFQRSEAGQAGEAGRLRRLQVALDSFPQGVVEEVRCLTDEAALPEQWRRLLAVLPTVFGEGEPTRAPEEGGGSVLAHWRRHLQDPSVMRSTGDGSGLDGDDSVRLVCGPEQEVAEVAAQLVASAGGGALWIGAREDMEVVNACLVDQDAARFPAQRSRGGEALPQVVPLTLRLLWGPFDPQAWLEFLLHPFCPLSSRVRHRLARGIQEVPGWNPERWEAWRIEAEEGLNREERKRLKQSWNRWSPTALLPSAAVPEQAISGSRLAETCGALGQWMRGRADWEEAQGRSSSADWALVSGAVDRLAAVFRRKTHWERAEAERWWARWITLELGSRRGAGEVSEIDVVAGPGQVLEPVREVFWWEGEERRLPLSPWTQAERTWLGEQGLRLPDRDAWRKEQECMRWRPFGQATERVTLFAPIRGQGRRRRGVSALVSRLTAWGVPPMEPSALLDRIVVPLRPMSVPKRWWKLPAEGAALLTPRESESFSSLQRFLFRPHQWVLESKAGLRKGPLLEYGVRDDARRRGKLLHGFVENLLEPETEEEKEVLRGLDAEQPGDSLLGLLVKRLLDPGVAFDWKSVDEKTVGRWVDAEWPQVLEQTAAHYRLPRGRAAGGALAHLARSGLWNLLLQLREAAVTSARCEEEYREVPFFGGQLGGYVDLVVEREDGEVGVIDLKLSGKTYRCRELAENRHLQLAVYGYFLQQQVGKTPSCGYFLFRPEGQLYGRSRRFFPRAVVLAGKQSGGEEESDWSACWQSFEEVWTWRRAQMDEGYIEVPVRGAEGEPGKAPVEHWEGSVDPYDGFGNLVGRG
ncbi:MAG: PD-(D/E)XK nuclease family protein [Verrucomicrobiota bacterium]